MSSYWARPKFSSLLSSREHSSRSSDDRKPRCSNFVEFLALALAAPTVDRVGFYPVMTTALPTFSDASMSGVSFDVRKVRASALPHGLNRETMTGRDYIIVKQPRAREDGLVGIDSLDSIAVELQILRHSKVQQHGNIIGLLGVLHHNLGDDDRPHILPALVLEYAEFGDLHEFQAKGLADDIQSKYDICNDAALGLQCLHGNGIVHGDVKSANMLVCKHPSRPFIVKLSDFGFAISTVADEVPYLTGYTPAFAAPEIVSSLDTALLSGLDIYSYGIFLHTVLKGGRSFYETVPDDDKRDEHLWNMKNTNLLHVLLQLNLLSVMDSSRCLLLLFCKILFYCTQADPLKRFQSMDDVLDLLKWTNPKDLDLFANQNTELYKVWQFPVSHFVSWQRRTIETFDTCLADAKHLQDAPMHELLTDGYRRRFKLEQEMIATKPRIAGDSHYEFCGGLDLCIWRFGIALSAYRAKLETQPTWSDTDESSPVRLVRDIIPDLRRHQGVIKKMPRVVQDFIALELIESCRLTDQDARRRAIALFNLAWCHIDGIGLTVDVSHGLELLHQSAHLGSRLAREQVLKLCVADLGWSRRELPDAGSWPELEEAYNGKLCSRLTEVGESVIERQLRDSWNTSNAVDTAITKVHEAGDANVSMAWRAKLLHLAARVGSTTWISDFVACNADLLDTRNEYGQTPLIVACQAGNFDAATQLIVLGAEVRLADCDGFTALHWLISLDTEQMEVMANILVAEGADVNALGLWNTQASTATPNLRGAPARTSGTALHWAIAHQHCNIVDILLSLGAEASRRLEPEMICPYEMACEICEPEIIGRILQEFDSPDDANIYYRLAADQQVTVNGLFWVVVGASRFDRLIRLGPDFEQKTKDSLRLLTSAGVASDAVLNAGHTLKMTATFAVAYHQCDVDLLRSGLDCGFAAHLDSTFGGASSGGPAMSLAIAHKDRKMFECLIDAGASIHWRNSYGQDAIGLVAKEVDDIWFAERLIDKGADVNSGPHWPFYAAVYCGNLKMAKYLWDLGAKRDCRDGGGVTVLGRLITMRTRAACDRIKFILRLPDRDEGSGFEVLHSPDLLQHKSSALHLAVSPLHTGESFVEDPEMEERCRLTVATLLEKYDAPEHLNSTCGPHHDVPLGMAVEIGNHHAVRMLLEAGANPNAKDEYGRTPMDKNNYRLCFPTSIDVISEVSPDDTLVLAERLGFVNNNTLEIRSLLTSYKAETNVFIFPPWYDENPGARSLEWVIWLLRQRADRPQVQSTTPSWGGMPIEIPERPMQFEAQRLAAERRLSGQ